MNNPLKILVIFLSVIGYVKSDDSTVDINELENYIRWLVPDDGRVNGLAHSYLVKTGDPAGKLIIKYVFKQPDIFFKGYDKNIVKWLYGTQSNAAAVLAEMNYLKALPVLREHYNRDVPKYLKDSLKESIKMLESSKSK